MRFTRFIFLFLSILLFNMAEAQTSVQDFGIGTGSFTSQTGSTAFLPNPTSGTTWTRAGATAPNAPVNLQNTSNPLGTSGSYVRAVASTSTSVCKFSPMVSYSASTEFYTSFKVLFGNSTGGNTGATDGSWNFYQGNGAMYFDANDFAGAQVFTGLRFSFTATGTVNLTYRAGGSFVNTGLTTSSFNQATVLNIEIVGNNKTSGTINYLYNGNTQSVAVQKFDLYVNGVLIGNDLAEALLPANTNVLSSTFIGISSTANTANIFADDVVVYNAVPSCIGTTQTPTVSIAASPSGPICTGTPVNFTATANNIGGGTVNYNFKVNGSSVQNSSSNMYSTSLLTNGNTVSCDITITGGTCLSSNTASSNIITMTVNPVPTPSFSTQPGANSCVGSSVTYTTQSGQTNYLWTLPGIINSDFMIISGGISNTDNTVTLKWLTTGSKTVSVNYTSSGCTGATPASNTTNVNASPTPSYILQPGPTICSNTNASYITQSGQNNYVWVVPGVLNTDYMIVSGGIGNTDNSVILKWLTAGSKTVTVNYSDINSCAGTSPASNTTNVSLSQTPTVSIASVPSSPICIGTSVTVTATANNLGGGTISTYNFLLNGNSVQNTNSNTYTNASLVNGDFISCDINISGGNCLSSNTASSNTLNFVVNDRPADPESAPDQTYCYSGTGPYQLSVETSSPPPGVTADWYDAATGGNLVQSNTNDISIFITPTGPYPQTYTFWKEFRNISTGCVSVNRAPVNFIFILQPDLAPISPQSNPCPSTTFDLASILLIDNNNTTGTLTYYASYDDATNGFPTISSIIELSGTYYIRKDVGNDCYGIVSVLVNINFCTGCPSINAVSSTNPLCSNTTTTLTATGLNNMPSSQNGETDFGIQFKYFTSLPVDPYIGGTSIGIVPFGSLTMGNTVATLSGVSLPSGNLYIYAILSPISTNLECRPSAFQQILVNLPVSVSETHMNPSCPGGSNGFINLSVMGSGPFSYNWNTIGGSGIVQGQKDQTGLTAGTYNVTVTDNNGCTKTLSIILNSGVDNTPPMITCPPNITIQCNESTLPIHTGTATATDNCSSTTINFNDVNNYNGCGGYTGTISRTWTAKDASNNMSTCTQIITIKDNIPPIAVCHDITVTLNNAGQASISPAQINNGSTDICTPTANLNLALSQSLFTCANVGMNTVTLTVTDLCGNTASCTAKVTVQDNILPSITCPPNITIECSADKLPPATGTATGNDNCSIASPTFTDVNNFNGCGGYTGTITRTWKVTDPSGNTATCNQIITLKDNTPPTFNAPLPIDITINCQNTVPPAPTVSATDNCSASVAINLNTSTMQGTCVSGSTITRTWTATDACGNTNTISQKVVIVDVTPPVFTPPLPVDVTVNCGSIPLPADLTATDNCSGMMPPPNSSIWINEIHYDNTGTDVGEFVEVAGTAGLDLSAYTLYLYNGSGGAVYDTKVLSGTIDNESNGFGAVSFSYPSNGIQNGSPDGVALVNNITNTVLYFLSYEGTFVAVGGPANGMTSTDIGVSETGSEPIGMSLRLAGTGSNYAAFSWQTVAAESPGALNQGQTMVTVPPPPPTGSITYTYNEVKIPGSCPTQGTINRTYTATDACGNSAVLTQHITVIDTEAPAFVLPLPADVTVECDAIPTAPIVRAIDKCPLFNAGTSSVWINEIHYDNTGADVGEFVEVAGPAGIDLSAYSILLYNGADGLNYTTTPLTGFIDDEGYGYGAVAFSYPSNGIQNGSPDGIALVKGTTVIQFLSYEGVFTALNGIASGMTSVDIGVSETGNEVIGLSLQLNGSGNKYSDFSWSPPNTQSPGTLNTGIGQIVGNTIIIAPMTQSFTPSPTCIQSGTMKRTWTASDGCGNNTMYMQTITIKDTKAPVLVGTLPPSITIECDQAVPTAPIITATDNCDTQVPVIFTQSTAPGTCPQSSVITRSWSASDDCGNAVSYSYTITIRDTKAPVLIGTLPPNITIECDQPVPPAPTLTATDNCDPVVPVIFTQNTVVGNCPQNVIITRTYTATDDCGNKTTYSYTITVKDTKPPVFVGTLPPSITIECDQPVPAAPTLTATDNCDPSVPVVFTQITTQGSCIGESIITRTFTATDDCGNSVSYSYVITKKDTKPPVLNNIPADVTIECTDPVPHLPTNVTAIDNCDPSPKIIFKEVNNQSQWPQLCEYFNYTITRTWIAIDNCGNQSVKSQVIKVQDTHSPIWKSTPPQYITVQCDEDNDNNVDPVPFDACDQTPSLLEEFHYEPWLDGCVNSYTAIYTWTAGDKCGNTLQFTQYIYVVDTEAPKILCPQNIIVNSNIPVVVKWLAPLADDYCDGPIIPIQIQGPKPGSTFMPNSVTTIVYEATDECGNKSTCSFTVTIVSKGGGFKTEISSNDPLSNEKQNTQTSKALIDNNYRTEIPVLYQNEPNPFENTTAIRFMIPEQADVKISIFDIVGKLVKAVNANYEAGEHELIINNYELPESGVYYYQLQMNQFTDTKKMIFIR